jgi:outer membrane receptor for ferrienterochelin and colicin
MGQKKQILFFVVLLGTLAPFMMYGQVQLNGKIYDAAVGQKQSLFGANIYHSVSQSGAVTDENGNFSLEIPSVPTQLVLSYVGYKTDTLDIQDSSFISFGLTPENDLEQVVVITRKSSQFVSALSTQQVIRVSSDELLKAACCNLSESFETNPAIDVNFSDAVTGTKQIKMLGLTSPYILITAENIPVVRGAAQSLGLSFVPGTWVESMQITKGAGSVTNGYESIAGQINVELQKPNTDAPFYFNAFLAGNGRQEFNVHLNETVSDKWHTGLYVHGNQRQRSVDRNNDGFLDTPIAKQINILNRWQYTDTELGLVSFINARILRDRKVSGQRDFRSDLAQASQNSWGSLIDTDRADFSAKLGYVNPDVTWQTMGIQGAWSLHDQKSTFGLRPYDIEHQSAYLTFLYNSIIGDTRHKIKFGLNGTYDQYNERLALDALGSNNQVFSRTERGLGLFTEYAYNDMDKLGVTLGFRIDQHNLLGLFLTPRLHLKYQILPKTTLRGSLGRGKRIPNIFSEHLNVFATGRAIIIESAGTASSADLDGARGNFYGLNPEIAWNYGFSIQQKVVLGARTMTLGLDYYRTAFVDQVIVDWEQVGAIRFYNNSRPSWAQSYQLDLAYSPWGLFDLQMAYKYYDLSTAFDSGDKRPILIPDHRVFANLAYTLDGRRENHPLKFDLTFNWLGNQRLPELPQTAALQGQSNTPFVTTLNGQITKQWGSVFDWYFGVENISDLRQEDPIINGDQPFASDFDSSMVYGPIFGRMWYTGIRYKL